MKNSDESYVEFRSKKLAAEKTPSTRPLLPSPIKEIHYEAALNQHLPSTMAATSTPAAAPPKAKKIYTEEKAVHLIRVYGALVSGSLLIGWLHVILINPMKQEVKDMVRKPLPVVSISPWIYGFLTNYCFLWFVFQHERLTWTHPKSSRCRTLFNA